MSEEDVTGQTLGFVRTNTFGRSQAYGVRRDLLGSYDPTTGITKDAQRRIIAKGNVLGGLVFRNRR